MNEHRFTGLQRARVVFEEWQHEYNEKTPTTSLANLTPAADAEPLAEKGRGNVRKTLILTAIQGGDPEVNLCHFKNFEQLDRLQYQRRKLCSE